MDTTITTEPAGKRARNGSIILTDRLCEKRVAKRVKFYDRKCAGLYVSIIPAGVATFFFKFTDRTTGKQRSKWLGVYNPETFMVEQARTEVYALKTRIGNGENVADGLRQQKARKAKQGKTVDEIIEERTEWMKTPVRKPDGEMRPRIETWENVASHLRRFISPRLGKKLASEVTKHDIATLSNDIVAGKLGVPSVANARHMRRAASGLFNWAAEAGRDYVTASPCVNLPKLDPEHARTRVLSEDEIRIFWHGLDRDDLPGDRRTRLALEIINEALSSDKQQFVFASPLGDMPMNRKVMATALRGTKYKGKVKRPGICALLGLRAFTPHDLRRTAATLAGDLGFDDAWIAKCLDHAASKKQEQIVPSVTGKVYNHSKRMKEKRAVLDGVAAELRRIIGEPAETELRLVA